MSPMFIDLSKSLFNSYLIPCNVMFTYDVALVRFGASFPPHSTFIVYRLFVIKTSQNSFNPLTRVT